MPNDKQTCAETNRRLVMLRPSLALRAAETRANLRPLYEAPTTAAATLWIEKYKNELPPKWPRVEAVRHALFETAKLSAGSLRAAPPVGARRARRRRPSLRAGRGG